jgi:agmatine deiminase
MPPPEWARQRCIWTAWPSAADLWLDDLDEARANVAAMVRAIAEPSPATGAPKGARVNVLACGAQGVQSAERMLGRCAHVVGAAFGDIWLRDTGPIFAPGPDGLEARRFRFNGWGGKYVLEHDPEVGDAIAAAAGLPVRRFDFVLEGGAVDWDGEGTVLTTRQCLLNPNRNPGWSEARAEASLAAALGAQKVIWLGDGLCNDHTDGHVDNLARFVAPAHVVCQTPFGADDPNAAALEAVAAALAGQTDARGRPIQVTRIPSPGLVRDEDGDVSPASHMNFVITDRVVVMPTYEAHSTGAALAALARAFPGRRTVGAPARAILSGGGAFHCITQQQPEWSNP